MLLTRNSQFGRREVRERFRELMENNELGMCVYWPERSLGSDMTFENRISNPLEYIPDLRASVQGLHQDPKKNLARVVDEETLFAGAELAKEEHLLNIGERPEGITDQEWNALVLEHSKAFWKGPKDLLQTLTACFLASFSQGWIQVCTGNTNWPFEFGVKSP